MISINLVIKNRKKMKIYKKNQKIKMKIKIIIKNQNLTYFKDRSNF